LASVDLFDGEKNQKSTFGGKCLNAFLEDFQCLLLPNIVNKIEWKVPNFVNKKWKVSNIENKKIWKDSNIVNKKS
jgi:hypothetical protein